MVKKRSKTELLEDDVSSVAYHKLKEGWRDKIRWSWMPVKRLFFFGTVALLLLGYGAADLSGELLTVQQACVGIGVFLLLAIGHVVRKHVLNGVRGAMFDYLKSQRTQVSWSCYGIDFYPADLVHAKARVEKEAETLDERFSQFTERLWGNLLFFVPGRVDIYMLEILASNDVEDLEARAAIHVENVKELVKMIEEARTNSNVVTMRRGGGIDAVF